MDISILRNSSIGVVLQGIEFELGIEPGVSA